ncbi:MAG: IPT/TIG domain-containing protein, partial [Candidatus Dormibacteria bacterium]
MPAATLLVVVTVLVGVAQGIRAVTAATGTLSIVVPKPYITGLTPSTIQAYGTAVITVSGGGFSSGDYTIQEVMIGSNPAASFTVDNPDMLTVVTPLLASGTYDIVATTSTGLVSLPAAPGDNTLMVLDDVHGSGVRAAIVKLPYVN